VRSRKIQFFFVAGALASSLMSVCGAASSSEPVEGGVAELRPPKSQIYALNLVDVDGNTLSTADGHVTVIVLSKPADFDKVRLVGDRVPDHCLGNGAFRLITLVGFEKKRSRPTRMILSALARRRLDAEAKRLQLRYTAKQLNRNPRNDVFAVLDFGGEVAATLGIAARSASFQVLVLGRNGELLQRWTEVPTAEQLAAVLK
jgi:hypothetical protein